jgi:hypothetical protein
MCKRVRIAEDYSDYNMAGVEAIIIKGERMSNGSVLLGFPLGSPFGWYDSSSSTEYRCWYIHNDYIEPVQVFSHNKFK